MEKFKKRCKSTNEAGFQCENFIPEEYDICDSCLLARYGLVGRFDSDDCDGMGPFYYEEDDVIESLRKAEYKNRR